jgi:superfamily I DNA/RNA helicase
MSWLVPFSSLTPEQQDAVSLDDKHHKAIIGGPGAGKSMVLLYRFDYLYNLYNKEVDSIHFFVYTTSLKDFIKSSFSLLDIPDNCITTFDKWCLDTYKKYIVYSVPYTQSGKSKKPDFEKIRSTVHEQITTGKIKIPLFKAILIDEAQDMDQQAVEIICAITKHVTVAMDGKQQLYDDRLAESGVLQLLNMKRHNVSLLSAYRCNPMVTNLAANFIDDIDKRNEFKRQAKNGKGDRYKPLFYIASGFDDEKKRLAELIHLRLSNNETIGILFPQNRLVYGYAKGLKELGIDIDTNSRNGLDFSNGRPKALTYHEAKGLTFDSVFMPKLDTDAFTNKMSERLKSLLFVGVSRAVSWVYLSGIDGKLIDVAANLCNENSKDYLEIQRKNITDASNSNQAELLDDNWLDDLL